MDKTIKKLILYGAAAIILAFLIGWGAVGKEGNNSNKGTQANITSALAGAETSFDFGSISMKDGKVRHAFELKNGGSETITINKVYTSCMCTSVSILDGAGKNQGNFSMPGHSGGSPAANIKVNAGETIKAEAIFDPNAHGPSGTGLAKRSVYLETDSKTTPKVELQFSANVTP